ncbi:MAG: hypothetical protein EA370_03050 [Wenzhouxiangella sp.]|nr:MAG: hypothetical protein EA370_03050 [Wenzhouxiangella sp.]
MYREQLRVDDRWSVSTPGGFKWWPFSVAQTVEVAGQEQGPDGEMAYYISVRTDLLRKLTASPKVFETLNQTLMPTASMAGLVFDDTTGTLQLASLVRVHGAIAQWMNPLISVAAVCQIHEAATFGPELARALDAEWATSEHPESGAREDPDEMAMLVDELILPLGAGPSRWTVSEFDEAVDHYMQQPPALMASGGGLGLTVEFPYGGMSSLCQINADQPHPRYGSGLLVVQSFPLLSAGSEDPNALALALNKSELTERPHGYGFGSFVHARGMIVFNAFFPNALYRPGLLPNLYFSCAERAAMMDRIMNGNDWQTASFSPSKTALGKLLDKIGWRRD